MKKLTITTSFLGLLLFSKLAYSSSDNCGQLSTNALKSPGQYSLLQFHEHNGKKLRQSNLGELSGLQHRIKKRPQTLYLAPGYHELLTDQGVYFGINIKPNKKYEVAHSKTKNKRFQNVEKETQDFNHNTKNIKNYTNTEYLTIHGIRHGIKIERFNDTAISNNLKNIKRLANQVHIQSIQDMRCNSSKVLPSLGPSRSLNKSKKLPPEISFKINELTKELQKIHKTHDEKIVVSLPARIDDNFGIIIGNRQEVSKGIFVISVSPDTSADLIGLQSQDRILQINKVRLTENEESASTVQLFKNELKNYSREKVLTLHVQRGGQVIKLEKKYTKILLPEIKIEIN